MSGFAVGRRVALIVIALAAFLLGYWQVGLFILVFALILFLPAFAQGRAIRLPQSIATRGTGFWLLVTLGPIIVFFLGLLVWSMITQGR